MVLQGLAYHSMYGVYDALDAARKAGLGQDELVVMTDRAATALQAFLDSLLHTAGVTALAAVFPVARPTASGAMRIMRSDAALEGTGEPGISGNLYQYVYVISVKGYQELPIVVLEFLGAVFNVIHFARMLQGAPAMLVLDALVCPIVLGGKATSPMLQFLHSELLALPEYRLVEDSLYVAHENGPFNPVCDCGSRGKFDEMEAIMKHLGTKAVYLPVDPRCVAMLDRSVEVWRALTPEV